MPTIVERDWAKPALNEKTGLYRSTNKTAGNLRPEYVWWNRIMKVPPEPVGASIFGVGPDAVAQVASRNG